MNEHLLRTAAPAALVVLEVEAVTRVIWAAGSASEEARLTHWLAESWERSFAVEAALADRDLRGGALRAAEWSRSLLGDSGGVVGALEQLLRER